MAGNPVSQLYAQTPPNRRRTPRPRPRPIIYLLVGAQGCGKTTFLQILTKSDPNEPHPPHLPYVIRNKNPRFERQSPELHFYEDELPWKVADEEQEEEDRDACGEVGAEEAERGQWGREADVVVVCYDVGSRSAIDSLPYLANHTLTTYPDSTTTILLGLKRDIRSSPSHSFPLQFITPDEGLSLAHRIGVGNYMECSAIGSSEGQGAGGEGGLMDKVEEDLVGMGLKVWIAQRVEEEERREGGFFADGTCVVV